MNNTGFSIFDKQKKIWWLVDRVVHDMDIVTTVEPAFNHVSATNFRTKAAAEQIINQVESEGNYDVENACVIDIEQYVKELEAEQKAKEKEMVKAAWNNTNEATKNSIINKSIQAGRIDELKEFLGEAGIDVDGIPTEASTTSVPKSLKGIGNLFGVDTSQSDWKEKLKEKIDAMEDEDEESIEAEIDYSKEPDPNEFLKVDESIDTANSYVIGGWMDWPYGEQFIKEIDLSGLEAAIKAGIRDEVILLDYIKLTEECSYGGLKQAKLFSEVDAKYIENLLNTYELRIGENDNFAFSVAEYIEEAKDDNWIVK